MTYAQTLAMEIRAEAARQRRSGIDIATQAGLSANTVRAALLGEQPVSGSTTQAILSVLGVRAVVRLEPVE